MPSLRPPFSWQEALQPGAECLLHLLQEKGQEEDLLLTSRRHTNVKRKVAKAVLLRVIQGWYWEHVSWGSKALCRAVPCRAAPPARFPALPRQGGFVRGTGEVPRRTGVRATSSLCSCFPVSAELSVCVLLFFVCCFNLARLCQETRDSSL